jgi:Ca2+-binding RTX toxin-like protein
MRDAPVGGASYGEEEGTMRIPRLAMPGGQQIVDWRRFMFPRILAAGVIVAVYGLACSSAAAHAPEIASPGKDNVAAPQCHGKPATIVGTGTTELEGTSGDDVVVTNGALEVNTFSGSDTVCVTLPPPGGYVDSPSIRAGSGEDLIDTSALPGGRDAVYPSIRPGGEADTVIGGPASERVETCDEFRPGVVSADDPDSITLAGGDDWVTLCPRTAPDNVDLGEGDDTALLRGPRGPHGNLIAGPGTNSLLFLDDVRVSDKWVMDLARRVSSINGRQIFAWDNVDRFTFDVSPGSLRITGSDEREEVSVLSVNSEGPTWTLAVDLAGGDDELSFDIPALGHNSRISAGSGHDSVHVSAAAWRVAIDLHRSTLTRGRRATRFSLQGVEDVSAYARYLRISGDAAPNVIDAAGCDAVVRARGGADTVTLSGFQGRRFRCPQAPHHAYGGAGPDELRGRRHNDTLIGGSGLDSADGHKGWDVCDTERRRRCEFR